MQYLSSCQYVFNTFSPLQFLGTYMKPNLTYVYTICMCEFRNNYDNFLLYMYCFGNKIFQIIWNRSMMWLCEDDERLFIKSGIVYFHCIYNKQKILMHTTYIHVLCICLLSLCRTINKWNISFESLWTFSLMFFM